MRMSKVSSAIVAAGLFMTAGAVAQPIASATYFDLSGNWDGAMFHAYAASAPGLMSSGSVARLVAPIGTADFEPGFVAAANPADFHLMLNYIPSGPGFGLGFGTFMITDADGDSISGNVNGLWIDDSANTPGQVFFNGALSNVVFTGGTFNGTLAGAFSTLFGGTPPYDGAITQLYLSPPGNFFTSVFSDVNTGVTMQILPAPGAAALMGLGGLLVARRRR
ncbi:MAG: hypothetical protein HBSAPP03_17240 [Phycisphaerae bacterium]|nr:MAG: hypothetical protein HBSAPP03_17240 [Phycisphaerae bacterium]